MEALIALGHQPPSDSTATAIVQLFPNLNDPWLESAAKAVAVLNPVSTLKAALAAPHSESLSNLIAGLAVQVAAGAPEQMSGFVQALGSASGNSAVKQSVLEGLVKSSKRDGLPTWSAGLKSALQSLMTSTDSGVQLATLPLVARWDTGSELSVQAGQTITQLMEQLKQPGVPEPLKRQMITSLVGVQRLNPGILPQVGELLGSSESTSLQEHAIRALGDSPDAMAAKLLASAFSKVAPSIREVALNQILRRPEASLALLASLKSGQTPMPLLGPAGLHRLRYHPDATVAKTATGVIDELRGPEGKEKQALIAKLTPEVIKPGDVSKGKQLFTQNCATCHRLGDEGKEVGPVLTGMGSHGAAELLVHILDPNREVDPSFASWNFETKEGESYDAILARENRASVFIRNAAGEIELKRDQIQSQRNTGRSLMPEGFESLGSEGLRDLLSYMTAADSRFRIIDMRSAYTADSTKGIFRTLDAVDETVKFKRFGMVQVGSVPFEILSPTRSPGGRNIAVLKGGFDLAKTFPKKVEMNTPGISASKIHFLGGVAGWGFPCCGENKDLPVAKVTVRFTDGKSEEFVLKNGVEFADYNGITEVPGSQLAPDLVIRGQQMRWFTKNLSRKAELSQIVLESYDNEVAPTFVAMTAEAGDVVKSVAAVSTTPAAAMRWADGVRTLLVGGGSSHDFNRWFNLADVATLKANGGFSVNYTEKYGDVIQALKQVDVLGWSANQPQSDPILREALLNYASSGKGLVLIHPGNWYIWNDWPAWNRVLVGGGTRSHDRYGEFEVTVVDASHPVMKGVPTTFKVSDELYHFEKDPQASAIQVLATGKNLVNGKSYPLVWITQHPNARIVNITLGHDGLSHDHEAYKTLLRNAISWAANKPMSASAGR